MDALEFAALHRARSALNMITSPNSGPAQAKAFVDFALTLSRHAQADQAVTALRNHSNSAVKAVAESTVLAPWNSGDVTVLAASYLASIAELSLLDSIKKFARILPVGISYAMIASDAVGDVIAEGDPKPVKNMALSLGDVEPTKSASILVWTQELARAGGDELRRLFETELAATVARATNCQTLQLLINSNTETVAGTGDPLTDLRIGLHAAGASNGYVVAAPASDVADLATRAENRGGMAVRGGTFIPGVDIVAIDDLENMHVIPASRLALLDHGLQIRPAEHASVDMRDTPESPAILTSLWQTNCIGLLIERNWHLGGDTSGVVIVESGS